MDRAVTDKQTKTRLLFKNLTDFLQEFWIRAAFKTQELSTVLREKIDFHVVWLICCGIRVKHFLD